MKSIISSITHPTRIQQYLIVVLIGFLHHTCYGQYTVDRYFPDVIIDSLWISGNGIGITNDDGHFLFRGHDVQSYATDLKTTMPPQFYFQDSVVTAYAPYNNGFLLSILTRLYYLEGSQLRQFSVPIEGIKENIKKISSCGDDFAILADNKMWIWNNDLYAYSRIAVPDGINLMASTCDKWNGFWISNGEDIYGIQNINETSLPIIDIEVNEPNQLSQDRIEIVTEEEVSFSLHASHTRWKLIQLQYMIEGDSKGWIDATNDESISIKFKNPGKNVLRVRASIDQEYYAYHDGLSINVSAETSFQWWWYLLSIPFVIIASALWISSREKKYQEKLKSEIEKYNIKAEAIKWENKANQLKMNPHFIFNVLTSIQGLVAGNENVKARLFLTKFSSLMRYMLKEGSLAFISIDEEINFLDDYLSLEQMTRDNRFTYHISNKAEDDLEIPPMLIQPLLENAIIHAFKGIDYTGKIDLELKNDDQFLYCTVSDNGIGRQKAGMKKSQSDHNSVALSIIERRLNTIFKFKKGKIVIEDLKDAHGSVTGTKALIKLPI